MTQTAARSRGDPDRARAAGRSQGSTLRQPGSARLLNIDIPDDASTWPDLATAAARGGSDGRPRHRTPPCSPATGPPHPAGKALIGDVTAALVALGGMATVDEIAERLVALRGSDAEGATRRRNAVGLVRAAVEADAGATLAILRHGHAVLVTTTDAAAPDERLEAAAALAAAVDDAVRPTDRSPSAPTWGTSWCAPILARPRRSRSLTPNACSSSPPAPAQRGGVEPARAVPGRYGLPRRR